MKYFSIQREEDCKKKIISADVIHSFLGGKSVNFIFRGILLLILKISAVCFEYIPPLILTQMEDSPQKYLLMTFSLYLDFFTQKYYNVYLQEMQYLVNAHLSQKLFNQCLKVHNETTFQGILKELRQVERAIRSFYDLAAYSFELPFVYHLLKNESLFDSLKYGVILSLFALLAASVAQIYAWRIQYFADKRLRLTQNVLCGIKSIKYLQWENALLKLIDKVREQEFLGNKGIQYVDTFVSFFRRMTQVVLLFVAFYKLQSLEQEQFYTILIFFDKLTTPINSFPWCFGEFLGSFFSIIKLYDYFSKLEQEIKLINGNTIMITSTKQIRIFDRVINVIRGDSWKSNQNKQFSLKLNFSDIPKNKLTCVIGQVGSGKTILLDYFCDGSYVSQNSWLFSGTVQQNILFGKELDEKKYQHCLKLAAIDFDDNKQVGFNGSNLSGGQKQRVSFCRALYNESQSYFFDDIFSSVDENVADHMFKSISTLLKGKTVILVLNQSQYLQYADYVIKIENGEANLIEMTNFQVGNVEFKTKPFTDDAIEPSPPEKEIDIETEQNLKENYQFYMKALGLRTFFFFIICSLLHQITKGGFELWIHSNMKNLNDFDRSHFVNFFLILSVLTFMRGFSYSYATIVSAKNIFNSLMVRFIHLPTKYYDIFVSSFFVRRLFDDVNEIDDLPLNYFFSVTLEFIGLFILISSIQLEIIPYALLAAFLLLKNLQEYRIFKISRQQEINRFYPAQDFDQFIIETEKGNKFIKHYQQERSIKQKFQKILIHKYTNNLSQNQLEYTLCLRNFIIESTVLILLIVTGNKLSYTYAYLLFGNQFLSKSISSWRRITVVSQSLQRIKQIIGFPQEEDKPHLQYKDDQIIFDNVWLSYGMAKGLANADFALKGVSFSIKQGEKVAFCGRTGSGKSSLFNLLVKLYEFQKGDIIFFGNPLSDYGTVQLRSQMSVIPQQGVILPGSIRDNIDPNQSLKNEHIDALLKSLDFNLDLNKNTETLSNGEKQVINFVQSILLDRNIILMDEATSNMDPETNDKIMRKLFEIIKNKTLLLISHKLENLQKFDKIFVMGDGQIQASGTYEQLLQNENFLELKSKL